MSQSCILCQLLRTKTLASGSKCNKHFFIFPTISHISAEWCDLFNMFFLNVLNGLMASFHILCSNTLNLKNKNKKIEHKKIFCDPSKTLENISWPVNICLKYFVTSTKTLRQPPLPSPPPKKVLL